jgi:DNA polymerase-1
MVIMKIVLVDTQQLLYRSMFSFGKQFDDTYVAIIYGTLLQIKSLVTQTRPDSLLFCWDSRESIRKDIYSAYKAKRKEDPNIDLGKLFQAKDSLKDIFEIMNWDQWEVEGLEADDLIANASKQYEGIKIIASTDNDLLQLLTEETSIYNLSKKRLYTRINFLKEYDIEPSEWSMVKAIAGCGGDNVSGIKGIGVKRAIDYLQRGEKSTFYSTIAKNWEIINRNAGLVWLPIVDRIPPKLRKLKFDTKLFLDVCEVFAFRSFEDSITSWKRAFHG